MVLKPFTHLARQTLSKAFTHGYAQSVVAASQSSYASSTTSLNQITAHPGKYTRTAQLQSAFQNPPGPSNNAGAKSVQAGTANSGGDSGLAAYYAAWQHAQLTGDDGDWKQFTFNKRIGWKNSSKDVREDGKRSDDLEVDSLRTSLRRTHSVGDTSDVRKV